LKEAQEWRNGVEVLSNIRNGSKCVNKCTCGGANQTVTKERRFEDYNYLQSGGIGDRRELLEG